MKLVALSQNLFRFVYLRLRFFGCKFSSRFTIWKCKIYRLFSVICEKFFNFNGPDFCFSFALWVSPFLFFFLSFVFRILGQFDALVSKPNAYMNLVCECGLAGLRVNNQKDHKHLKWNKLKLEMKAKGTKRYVYEPKESAGMRYKYEENKKYHVEFDKNHVNAKTREKIKDKKNVNIKFYNFWPLLLLLLLCVYFLAFEAFWCFGFCHYIFHHRLPFFLFQTRHFSLSILFLFLIEYIISNISLSILSWRYVFSISYLSHLALSLALTSPGCGPQNIRINCKLVSFNCSMRT